MSMADDNKVRSYRSNDPYRRTGEPSRPNERPNERASASDPLAELARLIGRNDPFAELGRGSPRQGHPPASQDAYAAPTTAPNDWQHASEHDQRYADDRPSREARDSNYDPNYDPNLGSNDGSHSGSSQGYPPAHGTDGRRQDRYQDSYQDRQQAGEADQDGYRHQEGHRYDEVGAAPQVQQYADDHTQDDRTRDGVQHDVSDRYFQDDVPLDPHDDETYDDAPRARRHGGLATALALIGCAMLASAGAYAYRSYTAQPGSTQPPPVITADNSTPTKIVPATAGDPQSSKVVQDRLANAGREQIVTKQEEPVALRELGSQTTPRVVLPSPVAPAGSQPSGGAASEPKKVRTVTIRPDGTDVSGRPVGALPSATQAPATTRSATTPPAPRATTPAAAPTRGGNGPISLDPQSSEPAAAPPAPARARIAAAPAAEATASTSSGFVVQLSSQKSESEAQASFRSLQTKFPNELGSRQPIIRRADLGTKGVFYRTMVGPFASTQEANQFCSSYKAAGGQCMVPNN